MRSADLEIDLVGLELHERVAGGDQVSFVSQPFRDAGVDDRFSDFRHDDIRSHVLVCPCLIGALRPAGGRQRRATGTLTRELCRFGVALGRWRLGRRAWPIGLLDERLLIQAMT